MESERTNVVDEYGCRSNKNVHSSQNETCKGGGSDDEDFTEDSKDSESESFESEDSESESFESEDSESESFESEDSESESFESEDSESESFESEDSDDEEEDDDVVFTITKNVSFDETVVTYIIDVEDRRGFWIEDALRFKRRCESMTDAISFTFQEAHRTRMRCMVNVSFGILNLKTALVPKWMRFV
jgi:hypothetical protein